jgi:hypothetical protein
MDALALVYINVISLQTLVEKVELLYHLFQVIFYVVLCVKIINKVTS